MKQVDMYKRIALIALMGVSLAGCSTVKGWFAGKDAAAKKAQEPAELVKFEPSVKVDKIWSTGVGKGEGHIGVRQRPAVADGKVYAAAITGGVQALDLQTGKRVWEYKPKKEERNDRKFKQRLSGGPGVGEGLVVIGTLSGDVIALNQADGTENGVPRCRTKSSPHRRLHRTWCWCAATMVASVPSTLLPVSAAGSMPKKGRPCRCAATRRS